mgnify:CR=1 FL=1
MNVYLFQGRKGFKEISPLPPVPEEETPPPPPPHSLNFLSDLPPSVPPRLTSISDDEENSSQAVISNSLTETLAFSKQDHKKSRYSSTDCLSIESDTLSQGLLNLNNLYLVKEC